MKIKGLIKEWKANIVCLQEKKQKFINREVVFSLWDSVHEDWCYLGSSGTPGGILLMWDRRVVEKVEDCVRRFIVVCSFWSVSDKFEQAFAGMYGPNNEYDRKLLWDELGGIMSWWEKPWCNGGDFNAILYPSERSGDTSCSSAMREFSDLNL